LEFAPRLVKSGAYPFDVGTAGAVTLVLQTLLPPLARANEESEVFLRGGTHVPWSPPFHYVAEVFLPMVALMGVHVEAKLLKAGWNPKGGGEVAATIAPASAWAPLHLTERGTLRRVVAYALISNLESHIAQRESNRAESLLRDLREIKPRVEIQRLPSIGEGTMVVVIAEFENTIVGFSAMGQIGKRAERVAEEAVRPFLDFLQSDATVDAHLADQLLLYMALAEGRSRIVTNELTAHARTNIWLIEKFLPVQFKVEGELGGRAVIEVG
jgi:RNA 3'-terminal phosphate cyclase (ATP)